MASLAASMLAGHIGLAFDLGLGVNASAGARRPCQLRGAWLQTRSGRRVQELLATPPIESGVSRDESGALDEGGARDTLISAKRRAASLALALAIGGGKRRVPVRPSQPASRARAGNVCASIKRCPPKHLAYDAAPSAVLAPSRLTPLVRRILDVHAASLASKRLPRAFRTRRCACSAAAVVLV